MIKKILKMGGCKTESEFYSKYPTQESFIEAFPQAVKLLKKGGDSTPPTAVEFFSYGVPTPEIPMIFQDGGAPTAKEFFDYGVPTPNIPRVMEKGGSSIPMNTEDNYVENKMAKFTSKLISNAAVGKFENEMVNLLEGFNLQKKGSKLIPTAQSGRAIDPRVDPNYRAPRIDQNGQYVNVPPYAQHSFTIPGAALAEGFMLPMNIMNRGLEDRESRYQDFKMLDTTLADSVFPMEKEFSGNYDQFGNFRPNRLSTPIAKHGIEVRGGGGFNTNFFPWPGVEGNYSKPDLEVNTTLKPVPEEEANVEVEAGETVVAPLNGDGIPEQYRITGKKHYEGGVPLNLPDHSYVFSDYLKVKDQELLKDFGITSKKRGVTFADIAKRYDLNKFKKKLLSHTSDDLERSTAEQMIANYNLKLGKLALVQESMKGFKEGIPLIAENYLSNLGARPEDLGMADNPTPNMQTGGEQRTRQAEVNARGKAENDAFFKEEERFAEANPYYMHTLRNLVLLPGMATNAIARGTTNLLSSVGDRISDSYHKAEVNRKYVEFGYDALTPEEKLIFDNKRSSSSKLKAPAPLSVPAPVVSDETSYPVQQPAWPTQPPMSVPAPVITPKPKVTGAIKRVLPATRLVNSADDSAEFVPEGYSTDYKKGGEKKHYQGGGQFIQYPTRSRIPKSNDYDILAPNKSLTGFSTQPFDPSLGYYSAVDANGNPIPLDLENFIKRQGDILSNYEGGLDTWKQHVVSKNKAEREKATGYFQKNYDQWRTDRNLDPYFYGQASSDPYGYDNKFGVYTWSAPGLRDKQAQPQMAKATVGEEDVPPLKKGEPINPVGYGKGFAPWWTQDIISSGAALGNLASVKKYFPWEGQASFDEADPTFISPERQLAANSEQLNIGAQTAAQFTDPQAFAANFSGMSGQAAKNAADILGNVNNINVGTANQFELSNTAGRNEYSKYLADRATRLYDKGTITKQQYDNAIRDAKSKVVDSVNRGLTNASQTDTLNKLSTYYSVDPITGRTYQKYEKPFIVDPTTEKSFTDEAEEIKKILMLNPEAGKALVDLFKLKWSSKMGDYAKSLEQDELMEQLRARGIVQ